MKKTITLTKMLTLAILLVTFTTATASFGGDEKCKTKCCKSKKNKEVQIALAEFEKAMNKLEVELRSVTTVMVTAEVKKSLQQLKSFTIASPGKVFAYAAAMEATETTAVDAKYKIDFHDLNREMDKEQERMTHAPDMTQKIDFNNIDKEMEEVQAKMSTLEEINS